MSWHRSNPVLLIFLINHHYKNSAIGIKVFITQNCEIYINKISLSFISLSNNELVEFTLIFLHFICGTPDPTSVTSIVFCHVGIYLLLLVCKNNIVRSPYFHQVFGLLSRIFSAVNVLFSLRKSCLVLIKFEIEQLVK